MKKIINTITALALVATLASCAGHGNTDSRLSSGQQGRANELYNTWMSQASSVAGRELTAKDEINFRCMADKTIEIIGYAPFTQKSFERAFNQAESVCKGGQTMEEKAARKDAFMEAQVEKYKNRQDDTDGSKASEATHFFKQESPEERTAYLKK